MTMTNNVITIEPTETRGRKRKYHEDRAASAVERSKAHKLRDKQERYESIAVLDMETDPFDNTDTSEIRPFVACLYSHDFDPVVIWEEDFSIFANHLIEEIKRLPGRYTIYAHNGGKFDYMFLLSYLRGAVSFKGAGLMTAKIGDHILRDSFHIIPEKLASYRKDEFDYNKLKKHNRNKYRDDIIRYLIDDCIYLLEIVKGFIDRFGMKISIGQAAFYELKKLYTIGTLAENTDATIRKFFYGGRVECISGKGHYEGHYKMYDVNSMYPYAMAEYKHPISANYTRRRKSGITDKTIFVEVQCRNHGGLITRGADGATTADVYYGTFLTTIWEYNTALELGMIERPKILSVIENDEFTDFSSLILPLYSERLETKARLKELKAEGKDNAPEYFEVKKNDIFSKLLQNNVYGKFAQNPRRFKEYYITEPGAKPEKGFEDIVFPYFECSEYSIWAKPVTRRRFNNVGTAASITGAARATLLRALVNAKEPIYCDTDSIICKELSNVEIDPVKLGAWDLEDEYSEVIICGKKLYACKPLDWSGQEKDIKIRSKGVNGLKWQNMLQMLDDEIMEMTNKGVTLTRTGKQFYMTRKVRATTPIRKHPTIQTKDARNAG